ncbi:MAG TPA: hypothetical protein VEG38_03380 [Acidimicrobiia bacterium]|nr:hypothetical protein [Acidimicrobiia bacterium]
MLPWKMLFRFFSAGVLFVTGGFAAGAELPVPFDAVRAEVTAPEPVADVLDTTTTTNEAGEPTTTTTSPPDVPEVIEVPVPLPVPLPEITEPAPTTPAPPAPAAPAKPPVGVPAPAPADPPPAPPVDGDASSVCAAAKAKVCGPAEPVAPTAADNTHAARVQRCQDWWDSLAQAFEQNGRPQWAARARKITGRCETMITRWEAAQQRGDERRQDRRENGDHNGDGHPDNGWHNKDERRDGDRRDGDRRDGDGRRAPRPGAGRTQG